VRARTALVNAATRVGEVLWPRLPSVDAAGEPGTGAGLNAELREVLEPLLKEIESLNERIQEYEVRVEKIAREVPRTSKLLKQ